MIGPLREDGVLAAAGDVAEGVGEEGLADTDGADDGDVSGGLDEAEGAELGPEILIEAEPPALDFDAIRS